nr:tetratricopeptide repeat protein [Candidatus Krumholzibacteria bacterium]
MTRVRFILLAGMLLLIAAIGIGGCRSAHTTSAILYIDEQNYDKAVQVIHEGFQFQDDEPDAYYYLGEAYSHLAEEAVEGDNYPEAMKNYELAYDAYMKAQALNPDEWTREVSRSLKYNYSNRLRQASLDWEEGYYEQAEGHLRLAYAALPDSLTPVKNIARMKMQMSNESADEEKKSALLNEALVLVQQALDANPEAYNLQIDKANILNGLGRNEEAGTIFDSLLAEHGDDTGLLMDIANLAIDEEDFARAADFYVRIVDLNEADTDAANDNQNKEMLLAAGSWYSVTTIGRYDDALSVLDRAANMELFPTFQTMLLRQKTFYKYGKKLKDDAALETDPVAKADLDARSKANFSRAVEIGLAATTNFPTEAESFLYLSMAQVEVGEFNASDANFKTYQELSGDTP